MKILALVINLFLLFNGTNVIADVFPVSVPSGSQNPSLGGFQINFSPSSLKSRHSDSDEESSSCGEEQLPSFFKHPECEAYRKQKATFCNCIGVDNLESNFLIEELSKQQSSEDIKKQKEFKQQYEERFFSTYSQMMFEEGVQRKILGIPDTGKNITCTPADMSKLVNKSVDTFVDQQKDVLKKKEAEIDSEINELGCDDPSRKHYSFKYRAKHIGGLVRDIGRGSFSGSFKDTCNKLKNDQVVVKKRLNELQSDSFKMSVLGSCGSNTIDTQMVNAIHLANLKIRYLKKYEKNNPDAGEATLGDIKSQLNDLTSNVIKLQKTQKELQNRKRSNKDGTPEECTYSPEAQKLVDDTKQLAAIPGDSFGQSPCDSESNEVCDEFNNRNLALLDEISDQYDYEEEERSKKCVSFGEFKAFKSLPENNDFFKEMSADPMKFLNPTYTRGNHAQEKLEFLRANPVLSRLVQDHLDNPEVLNEKLKLFATDIQAEQSEGAKLKHYIDFLKSLSEIYNSADTKGGDAKLCINMAKNYTAIKVSNELPPVSDKISSEPTAIDKMIHDINSCKESKDKAIETNMVETLKQDPLFSLAPVNPKESLENDMKAYDNYLAKNCSDYEDFYANNCSTLKGLEEKEKCREGYLNGTFLKEQKAALKSAGGEANPVQTIEELSEISSRVNESATHSDKKEIFEITLKHMDLNPVALKGHEKEFFAQKESEHKFFSTFSYPQRFNSPFPLSSPVAPPFISSQDPSGGSESTATSPKNVGQIIPSFSSSQVSPKPVTFNPAALTPSRTVAEAIPEYKTMPPEQKVKNLEAAKDFMKKSKWNAKQIKDTKVDDELADAKSKLEEERKRNDKVANVNRKVASVPDTTFSPSATTNSQTYQPSAPPSMNNAFNSGFSGGSISEGSSQSANAANSQRMFVPNAILRVKDGVVDAKEFKGPQSSSKDLVIDDSNKFKLLTKDPKALEAYLKKELNGMVITDYKIITIIDKTSNNPTPNLIFRVKQNKDGSFDIQSVPPEVPVRVATLKGLLNQLPKQ